VMRSSAPAIVGYFVVSLVLPGILVLLAQVRPWFADLQSWIDWNETQVALLEGAMDTGEEWAMLGSTTMIWIVVPLVVGLLSLRRAEVK
jgi:ABC-2 type transport system permease protein